MNDHHPIVGAWRVAVEVGGSATTNLATFGADGVVWISQSSGNRPAFLSKLDVRTGAVLGHYPAPGGIEDLGHAPDGRLWAVSEAGTRRWSRWNTFYPLVFEIDPAKLAAA